MRKVECLLKNIKQDSKKPKMEIGVKKFEKFLKSYEPITFEFSPHYERHLKMISISNDKSKYRPPYFDSRNYIFENSNMLILVVVSYQRPIKSVVAKWSKEHGLDFLIDITRKFNWYCPSRSYYTLYFRAK